MGTGRNYLPLLGISRHKSPTKNTKFPYGGHQRFGEHVGTGGERGAKKADI